MGESISDISSYIQDQYGLKHKDIRTYSPLSLAYIGDAIYDLVVRTYLVEKLNTSVNNLHVNASRLVSAHAQSTIVKVLKDTFTEEEISYFKRGRNAKSNTSAKNASIMEYRNATGFEALLGYLYLTNQMERILTIVHEGLDILIREEKDGKH